MATLKDLLDEQERQKQLLAMMAMGGDERALGNYPPPPAQQPSQGNYSDMFDPSIPLPPARQYEGNTLADIARNPNPNWSQETKDALARRTDLSGTLRVSHDGQNVSDLFSNAGGGGQVQQPTFRNTFQVGNNAPSDLGQSQQAGPGLDYSMPIEFGGMGKGYRLKGDATRAVLADGRIIDMGRDTGAERARMKEDLGLDAQRANIAHTQMQTDPAKAAEYARQVAAGKQQGEMTGFNTQAQQSATGANALSGLPPAMADQVKALAEGRMAFPSGFALKSPYWQQMLQMVSQYDPNFDAINYNTRAATRKDFTSGKSAENIKSLNTAIGHLDTIQQKFDALDNSSIPSYNTAANWLGSKGGNENIQSAVGGFDTAKLAVSGEMAKVFRSVGMSQQEIEHWMDRLSSSQSPADFKSTIKTATDLMGGRLDAIGDQYTKGMGKSTQGLDLLSPDAKKQFQKIQGGGNTSGGTSKSVTLPNGTVKVFPSGAAAEAFRMETGLK